VEAKRALLSAATQRLPRIDIAGIEAMHMVNMGQLAYPKGQVTAAANQFYRQAFEPGASQPPSLVTTSSLRQR
jgi:hypothetical protein